MSAQLAIEGLASEVAVLDITNKDSETFAHLEKDLYAAKGKVGIVVHPHFDECSEGYTEPYLEALSTFVTQAQQVEHPLVIFEEENQVANLGRLPITRTVYVVRTYPGDPTPVVDKTLIQPVSAKRDIDGAIMGELVEDLQHAGMGQAAIAGRLLWIFDAKKSRYPESHAGFLEFKSYVKGTPQAKPWIEKQMYPDGCVGGVIQGLLARNIPVHISPATSPHTYRTA